MKKIFFSDKYSLTQAVLDGRKTMTRRVCKYDRPNETYDIVFPVFEPNDYDNDGNIVSPLNYAFGWKNDKGDFTGWNIPKYKVGEVCAIAQSYETIYHEQGLETLDMLVSNWKYSKGWRNRILVRADFMPHHIRITNIKIERLQNISDEDCFKEGIFKWDAGQKDIPFYSFHNADIPDYNDSRDAFAELIDKVSGKGTWVSNPYAFVYEFELID